MKLTNKQIAETLFLWLVTNTVTKIPHREDEGTSRHLEQILLRNTK